MIGGSAVKVTNAPGRATTGTSDALKHDDVMSKSVIIIGASARAASESAVRAGFRVIAFDQFGDRDTRSAAEVWQQFAPPADESPASIERLLSPYPDLPVIVVGGFESWNRHLDKLRPHHCVLAPTSKIIRQLRSLDFLEAVARQAGLRFPKSIDGADELQRIKATPGPQPVDWLIKSTDTSAGLGISRFVQPGSRESDWLPGTYAQQRQAGCPFGASFLATAQETYLIGVCRSFTHRIPGHPFLYSGSVGPISLSREQTQCLRDLGRDIAGRTGLRGLFGVDLLHEKSSDTLWLLEINPRYTASMEVHELAALASEYESVAPSLIDAHYHACLTQAYRFNNLERSPQTFTMKKVVWARNDYRWLQDFETSIPQPHVAIEVSLHDLPSQDGIIPGNTPILTILGRWSNPSLSCGMVLRQLKRIEKHLLLSGTMSAQS